MRNQSKVYAFRALASMSIMYTIVTGIAWNSITLYADSIVTEWGITSTQFMLALTIQAVANAVISVFFYGPAEAKLGIRNLTLIGGIIAIVAQVIMANSYSLPALYLSTLLMGIGISPLNANTNLIVISNWFKKNIGTYTSISMTIANVVGILATSVYGALILMFGWRFPIWVNVVLFILMTVLMRLLYKGAPNEVGVAPLFADEAEDESNEETVSAEKETGGTFGDMLRSPRFYILVLGYFLVGSAGYAAFGNLALMTAELGHGAYSGTVLSVALIGSAATLVLCGTICDKLGSKWSVTITLVLACAGMLILSLGDISLPLIYVAAALLGIGYNATQVPAGITAREVFGTREYGKKVGILVGINFIGLAFGPTIMAAIYNATTSYSTSLMVLIVMAVIAVILLQIGAKKQTD